MPSAGRRSRIGAAAGILALSLLVAGCGSAPPAETLEERPGAAAASTPGPLAAAGPQDPRAPRDSTTGAAAGEPTGVRIPAIGVDSTLEDLGVDGTGRLDAPVDYDAAGWYADGVVPGAIGPAIIAGHIDSPSAPAVFVRLGDLAPGDDIFVTMTDGSELRFAVTGFAQSAKSDFPTAEVYSNVPVPELRLITCAGDFDSGIGHYTDNLIVFAALRD